MHRRTYSYTSTWSDPDELLESARQSVKTIQHLGSQVVDGFWGIVSKSQEWINNNNNKGHGNVADRRVSEEMDVHVVMVIRASVVLEGGRSRVSDVDLVEAFSPLKATVGQKDVQIWTSYQDGSNLEFSKHFSKRYFEQQTESGEMEGNSVGEVEDESGNLYGVNFFENGLEKSRISNLAICVNPKYAKFAQKNSNAIDNFQRHEYVPHGNRSGLVEAQELLSNLVRGGVSVMILVGLDLERSEPNELMNINKHQIGVLISRTLGLLPGTCLSFHVERYRRFGNDFWLENSLASSENPARKHGEIMLPVDCCCVICTDPFDTENHRPMVLPCGHTIGQGCLGNLHKCPTCLRKFDPKSVPVNYSLESFIVFFNSNSKKHADFEEKEKMDENSQVNQGEICGECGKKYASLYCSNCDVMFCEKCSDRIHSKALSKHSRVQARNRPDRISEFCEEHKDEKFKYFCLECSKQLCMDCKDGDHAKHDVMSLVQAVDDLDQNIREEISSKFELYSQNVSMITVIGKMANDTFQEFANEVEKRKNTAERVEKVSNSEKQKFGKFREGFQEKFGYLEGLKCTPSAYFTAANQLRLCLVENFNRILLVKNETQQLLNYLNAPMPNNGSLSLYMGKLEFPEIRYRHSDFKDSCILKSWSGIKQIKEWFGKPVDFHLLYRGSRDGFKASEFHRLCDNQGATFTVLKSANGYIFGGFVSRSWTSSSLYHSCDGDAWLFSLTNPKNLPLKIPSNNTGACMYDNISYGPTYGGNHDLHIADMANSNSLSYCKLGGSYLSPQIQDGLTFLCGSFNFQISEIEVYQVR